MSEEERRLAAIMITDLVGYTALTQKDEALALQLLEEHRRLLRPLFHSYGGQEIKSTGDGFLVEFPSALQATRCAIEIQRALNERNASVLPEQKIEIRIGLHVGDIVHREGDVLGDGVNITSRIEPLAKPGGICLSEQVYAQVWNKIEAPLMSLGRQELEHVQLPMEIYRVVLPWEGRLAEGLYALDKRRIAVLPLMNISPDPQDEYFTDGMTEEIIYTLSKIRKLKVIAQTSVMTYKGQRKKIAEIGQELRVGTVLEGSVRKSDSKLRITVQLVDVESEEHRWSEAYDRDLEDVFAIQSDIAEKVAQALQVKLLAGEKQEIEKEPTEKLEAYNLYLKGRYFSNKRTGSDLEKAIEYFKQAIEIDPDYALAYAGLADIYNLLPTFSTSTTFKDAYLQAEKAALQALMIDDTLAEAHASLALLKAQGDWEWEAAESEFKRAIQLNPGYPTAHHWYAIYLVTMHRFDEAIGEIKQALQLDPLSLITNADLGQVYYCAGNYDQAIAALQNALEMDPNFAYAHLFLGLAYVQKSMYEEALAAMEKAKAMSAVGWISFVKAWLGLAHVRMGNISAAQEALESLVERSKKEHVPPTLLASLYFALGENDQGSEWLDRAYEARDVFLFFARTEPLCENLHSSPRFTALLKKMGLED